MPKPMIDDLKNKDLFQSMFQSSVESILVADENGTILMVNPACEELFGYDFQVLVGQNIEIIIPKKFRLQYVQPFKANKNNPKARVIGEDLDVWGIKKNGTQFSLDINLSQTIFDSKNVTIAFIRDATKRQADYTKIKQINTELLESNKRYDTLLNNLQGMAYCCKNDKSRTVEYFSKGCLEITGYSFMDFKENRVIYGQLILKEDRKDVWKKIQTAIKNKRPYDLEYRIQHKNGSIKQVWEKGEAVCYTDKEAISIEGFVTDITTYKEQEISIKMNEAKLKALLEAMPDTMFIQDLQGNYLDWYAKNTENLFVPPNKFLGVNMKNVLPAHVYKPTKVSHNRVIATGAIQITEYSAEVGGILNHFEARVVPISNHSLLTIVRNTTEKHRLQQKIEEQEIKSKAILEALPDLVSIQDADQTIIEVHCANALWLPKPKEDILGKNIIEILPAKLAKQISTILTRVIETKTTEVVEFSMKTLSGKMNFEVRLVPFGKNKTLSIARNITDKKNQDKELLIKDRALASANNSILIADARQPHLPIIYYNEAFEKMTGYSKEDTLGRNCHFLQNDDRDQDAINIMRNAVNKGEPCNVLLRNYKKDGTLFWNDITITPVYNKKNQVTHFIGIQNDVTSRIEREDLKDKTQEILELIARDADIKAIGTKIIETLELHLDSCLGSILLLNEEQNTLHKLVAPNLPMSFCKFIEGISIGPKVGSCGTAAFLKKEVIVANIETNVLWEDYKEVALKNNIKACWAFPIMSSNNRVLGTVSIYSKLARKPGSKEKELLLDMTHLASIALEKHQNTTALKESRQELFEYALKLEEKVEARTKEVMETVKKLVETNLNLEDQILITKQAESDALAIKSIASEIAKNFPNGFVAVMDKELKIVFAEGEAIAQLGLKQFSNEGMSVNDVTVFAEARIKKINSYILETLAGSHLSFEMQYKNRYFTVNTAPLFDEHNLIRHALLVYTDISEQKKIEFNIQNALKQERELSSLKSRFVSMASHEFRTPLSAILTSAVLIGKQNQPGKALKREKYIEQIERNVKYMVIILNDFLSLSKLEEGKIVVLSERFNLISFSKQVIKEISPTLKAGQSINVSANTKDLYVYLDVKLLRSILSNLLSNASKYSPEGAHIDLEISQEADVFFIKITDLGIGIPEEEQHYLFERFFRAKNVSNIEGTGLGLNIVKNYTELMGGTITVESAENKGAIFTVKLPNDAKSGLIK